MNHTRRSMAVIVPLDLAGPPVARPLVEGVVLERFEQALNPSTLPTPTGPQPDPAASQAAQATMGQAPPLQPCAEPPRQALSGPAMTWPKVASPAQAEQPLPQAAQQPQVVTPRQDVVPATVMDEPQVVQPQPDLLVKSQGASPAAPQRPQQTADAQARPTIPEPARVTQPSPHAAPQPPVTPLRPDVLPATVMDEPQVVQPQPDLQVTSPAASQAAPQPPQPPAAAQVRPTSAIPVQEMQPLPQATRQPQVTPSRPDVVPAPVMVEPQIAQPQPGTQATSQGTWQAAPQLAQQPAAAQVQPTSPEPAQVTQPSPQAAPLPHVAPSRPDVVPGTVIEGPQVVRSQPDSQATSQRVLQTQQQPQPASSQVQLTSAAPVLVTQPFPQAALKPQVAPSAPAAVPAPVMGDPQVVQTQPDLQATSQGTSQAAPQPQVVPSRQDVFSAPLAAGPQVVQLQPRPVSFPLQPTSAVPVQLAQPWPRAAHSGQRVAIAPVLAEPQIVQQSLEAQVPPSQQQAVGSSKPTHAASVQVTQSLPEAATSHLDASGALGAPLQKGADEEDRLVQAFEQTLPMPALPLPPPAAPASGDPQAVTDTGLRERLLDTVQQLMVSDTHTGGAQVRMVLHEALLPGTTITVQQAGAQLQVSFECTALASRQRLDRSAPAFAQSLARRLGRDVLVQVHDQTGDALAPVQARADASEAGL